ncbi:hypothetical protein WJX77_010871 [Trebouxia sp. C0004]
MSVLSSLAGAPLLKGKRNKGVTGKTPGLQSQRTDAAKPGLGSTSSFSDNSDEIPDVSIQLQDGASANPPHQVVSIARSSADNGSVLASVADEGSDLLDIIGGADTQSTGLRRAASAGRRAGIQQKPAGRVGLPTTISLLSNANNTSEVEQALDTRGPVQGLKQPLQFSGQGGNVFNQQPEQQNEQPREAWSQQVTSEQKQLAQETVESHKSLEAARTAELTARKAALEFEARASLALKEAEDTETREQHLLRWGSRFNQSQRRWQAAWQLELAEQGQPCWQLVLQASIPCCSYISKWPQQGLQ